MYEPLKNNGGTTAGASEAAAVAANPDPEGLTPQERRFVEAYYRGAKYNATRAAEMAGYAAGSRQALRVTAWRLMHRPRVSAALKTAYRRFRDRVAKQETRRAESSAWT
jgi:hypothetical protein